MSKINLLKINDPKGGLPDSFYKYSIKKEIKYPILSKNYKSQICIIGAGFTGLSAGLCLAESGFEVIILEANRVGFGASGRNGCLLYTSPSPRDRQKSRMPSSA